MNIKIESLIRGYIDVINDGLAIGWVSNASAPAAPLHIELIINGQTQGAAVADGLRKDVTQAGISNAHCGFAIPLRTIRSLSECKTIEVLTTVAHKLVIEGKQSDFGKYAGHIDLVAAREVSGWACDLMKPEQPLHIIVYQRGKRCGRGVTDRTRADVLEAGYPSAQCGFHITLDEMVEPNVDVLLIDADTGERILSAQQEIAPSNVDFQGRVDGISIWGVSGWCVDKLSLNEHLTLEVICDGRVVGRGAADQPRPDVIAAGLATQPCGFVIPFEVPLPEIAGKPVMVRDLASGREISGIDAPAPDKPIGFVDSIEGVFISGWAVDPMNPHGHIPLEAHCEGQLIARGTTDLHRDELVMCGFTNAGFRLSVIPDIRTIEGKDISITFESSGLALDGSPISIKQNRSLTKFLSRQDQYPPNLIARYRRKEIFLHPLKKISIVMPVYNTPHEWLRQSLNSVMGQWSPCWELLCVNDSSPDPLVQEILLEYQAKDDRIMVLRTERTSGIATATNLGIRNATGPYITFMDHDDYLEPDAVLCLLGAADSTKADLIYSDEMVTSENINNVMQVRARPAFSNDYYMSHPYFVHLVCVKREQALAVGGWDESMKISADVDFVYRILECADFVAHIPRVLYRWRTHSSSAGHVLSSEAPNATLKALKRHVSKICPGAEVELGLQFNEYLVKWPDPGGKVLIVIPTKNKVEFLSACITSIEQTCDADQYHVIVIDHESDDPETVRYLEKISERHQIARYQGPFNYSRINNFALENSTVECPFVLFLNNDTEAIEKGWIERMRSLAGRADVGIVGPMLLYADDRVQHAGVLVGFSGAAEHAHKFINAFDSSGRNPGYNCALTVVRDYSAVTAACMMMRTAVFSSIGGFDETLPVGFNDTDLCLRVRELGLAVLYDGHTVLRHYESATRRGTGQLAHPEDSAWFRKRWSDVFARGDDFYSPLLTSVGVDHILIDSDDCDLKAAVRVRLVALRPAAPVAEAEVAAEKITRARGTGKRNRRAVERD